MLRYFYGYGDIYMNTHMIKLLEISRRKTKQNREVKVVFSWLERFLISSTTWGIYTHTNTHIYTYVYIYISQRIGLKNQKAFA